MCLVCAMWCSIHDMAVLMAVLMVSHALETSHINRLHAQLDNWSVHHIVRGGHGSTVGSTQGLVDKMERVRC